MTPPTDQSQAINAELLEALILAHDILTHIPRAIWLQVPTVKREQIEAALAKAGTTPSDDRGTP
jgi:hypothetical protein